RRDAGRGWCYFPRPSRRGAVASSRSRGFGGCSPPSEPRKTGKKVGAPERAPEASSRLRGQVGGDDLGRAVGLDLPLGVDARLRLVLVVELEVVGVPLVVDVRAGLDQERALGERLAGGAGRVRDGEHLLLDVVALDAARLEGRQGDVHHAVVALGAVLLRVVAVLRLELRVERGEVAALGVRALD